MIYRDVYLFTYIVVHQKMLGKNELPSKTVEEALMRTKIGVHNTAFEISTGQFKNRKWPMSSTVDEIGTRVVPPSPCNVAQTSTASPRVVIVTVCRAAAAPVNAQATRLGRATYPAGSADERPVLPGLEPQRAERVPLHRDLVLFFVSSENRVKSVIW